MFMIMETPASKVIDAFGGTTAVARLVEAPVSTVHSWRKNGIPNSRLHHLRLASRAKRIKVDIDALLSSAPAAASEQAAA
ncbi:carph-isopro domain-containing protein [uncultured Sphingomonas sp.]|uniref:carph-isopro domain-containing protein n=1 Tax=uncultured Sphingomonas sp. TaxID=158754 RepID=UPI00345BED51